MQKKILGIKWPDLVLLIVSVIFSLFLLELFLSFVIYPIRHGITYYESMKNTRKAVFIADEDTGFRTAPNLLLKREIPQGVSNAPRRKMLYDMETNALGFRFNQEITFPKLSDEIRIFCLGGSTTMGGGVPNPYTYPQVLNDLIDLEDQVKVINAGVGGYRSIHLVEYYKKYIRPLKPDIVTIYSGWNDFEDNLRGYWKPNDPHGHALLTQLAKTSSFFTKFALGGAFMRFYFDFKRFNRTEKEDMDYHDRSRMLANAKGNRWLVEYRRNIRSLINLIREDQAIPLLIKFPAPQFEGASEEVKDFANKDLNMSDGWDVFVIVLEKIRRTMGELSTENSIKLIDVSTPFEKYNKEYKEKFLYFVDRMHLNKAGNRLIAETILPELKVVIEHKRMGMSPQ